jgi:hypothetical protein
MRAAFALSSLIAAAFGAGCVPGLPGTLDRGAAAGGTGAGGSPPPAGKTVLASGQSGTRNVAVDSTSAYWASPVARAVMKVSLDGGPPVAIAEQLLQPSWVTVDSGAVYWSNAPGEITKVSVDGGAPLTIATGGGEVIRIVVSAGSVYWNNTTGQVMKIGLDGGTPTVLVPVAAGSTIAVSANYVYWFDGLNVMKVSASGGQPIAVARMLVCPLIAVHATSAYCAGGAGTGVVRIGTEGGPTRAVTGSENDRIASMAADATGVYWTAASPPGSAAGYSGWVYGASDTEARVIANEEGFLTGVALDATSVYWVAGTGTIIRAPK